MKLEVSQLCYMIFVMFPFILVSQDPLSQFNELPATEVVRAPEFDIEHKYAVYFDKTMNLLLIKEENRNPVTGHIHFDQRIYEVPIDHLSKSSFVVERDESLDELRLIINMSGNSPQIHTYWISEGEIVSILVQSKLGLGPWKYSEQLELQLESLANELGEYYGGIEIEEASPYRLGKVVYKYGSDRAIMVGKKDLDGKLNNQYYFPYSITDPPRFRRNKDLKYTERALRKSVKKQLGIKDKGLRGIPVFLYLDENGKQESVFIGVEGGGRQIKDVDLDEFQSGGKNNNEQVKCKFIILL